MNMLGQTVAQLRTANGWSMQELASRVRQAGARNVQYQHIQQLESKPATSPRYVVELALAFGKTVEELRSWKTGDPYFGHHGIAQVNDPGLAELQLNEWGMAGSPGAAGAYTSDEIDLLAAYRASRPEVRNAIKVLLRATRKDPQAKSA